MLDNNKKLDRKWESTGLENQVTEHKQFQLLFVTFLSTKDFSLKFIESYKENNDVSFALITI